MRWLVLVLVLAPLALWHSLRSPAEQQSGPATRPSSQAATQPATQPSTQPATLPATAPTCDSEESAIALDGWAAEVESSELLSDAKVASPGFTKSYAIPVFYATNRKWTGEKHSPKYYGAEARPDGEMELGYCIVSIPPDHELGKTERPRWWRLELREDLGKHVVVLQPKTAQPDDYYGWLNDEIARSSGKQAFVFVHGFNVTFEQAAHRTGQLAFDLNFDGASILFSWPSQGSVQAYKEDLKSAKAAAACLQRFLEQMMQRSNVQTLHLFAHSMGARVVTAALQQFHAEDRPAPAINELVLAAADVEVSEFRQRSSRLVEKCRRVSIYVSDADLALKAASEFMVGECRIGLGRPCLGENFFGDQPAIEVIDAEATNTGIFGFGHEYYGNSKPLLRDLRSLLMGVSAPMRGLTPLHMHYRLD